MARDSHDDDKTEDFDVSDKTDDIDVSDKVDFNRPDVIGSSHHLVSADAEENDHQRYTDDGNPHSRD